MCIPLELVAGLIEGEITELELWGRKSPGYSLTRGAEMMPYDPQRSNSASNLGIYTKFTPSLQNLHCNPEARWKIKAITLRLWRSVKHAT
jgi:hypothetical protein